jgi:hypothetical protein
MRASSIRNSGHHLIQPQDHTKRLLSVHGRHLGKCPEKDAFTATPGLPKIVEK